MAFQRLVFIVILRELLKDQQLILEQIFNPKLIKISRGENLCTHIYSFFKVPYLELRPVRRDNYSVWLIFCYLTRSWLEGISRTSFFCKMIVPKMKDALMSAILIFKERLILIYKSNICMTFKYPKYHQISGAKPPDIRLYIAC